MGGERNEVHFIIPRRSADCDGSIRDEDERGCGGSGVIDE